MKRTLALSVMGLVLGVLGVTNAVAGPVTIRFTTPTNLTDKNVNVTIGQTSISVKIPAGTSAEGKRDLIKKAIEDNKIPKFTVDDAIVDDKHPDPGITIKALTKGTKVHFDPLATGETEDSTVAMLAPDASFGFNGMFAALDGTGMPSLFTGGLITDIGQLAFTVSATDLPALDGVSITQAFFNLLSPSAALFGAQIVNQGNTLQFLFDPGVTFGGAGVVFGTTSLSEGVFGEVTVGEEVPEPATLLLLGTGLVCVARTVRWRRMELQIA